MLEDAISDSRRFVSAPSNDSAFRRKAWRKQKSVSRVCDAYAVRRYLISWIEA